MIAVLAVQPLLGQDPPAPVQGPEFGGSSPIGLVVTLFMLIALVFLIRSMNKHLRKVPPSFDPPETDADTGEGSHNSVTGASGSDTSGSAAATADRPSSGSASNSTPKS